MPSASIPAMPWIKIPKESHPILIAALPKDSRVRTLNMFGGTFARSAIVKLSEADQQEALALDGAESFDPMGNGRVMTNTVLLPESIMDEPAELKSWLARAFAYAATLPPKRKTSAAKKSSAKQPAKKSAAKRPAAKKKRAVKKR